MPLRIGINALFLIPGGVGGTEVSLRNLLAAFARSPRGHEFVVFLNRETEPIAPTNATNHPDTALPNIPALPSHDRQGVVFPVEALVPSHPGFHAVQTGVMAKSRPPRII